MTDFDDNLKKFLEDIGDLLERAPGWVDRGQTTTVLTSVAMLEEALEAALISRMRPLTKKMRDRLFEGYGPISSFAARVDIAYAIEIISEEDYKALLIIKSIRNKFAHSNEALGFDREDIASLAKRLNCRDPKADTAYRQYFATLFGIAEKLLKVAETSGSVNIIGAWKKGAPAANRPTRGC
jgi:DNA-binding MltR family transcriptional regulator